MVVAVNCYGAYKRSCPSCASGVGSTSNSVTGIDAMCPSSKEDFTEFEKLLKEKITQFEKSVHYTSFLDSLFRELCISCKLVYYFIGGFLANATEFCIDLK